VETHKILSIFRSNFKYGDTSPTQFWRLSNHLQQPQILWKGATIKNQTCSCVHWFRWRTLWAFVVNCDLINNKNSTVIKLGTSTVNVLCHL
jgi:hypothetical protein